MRLFNQEEINELKEAEQHFATTIRAKYKRNTTVQLNNKVADIYERVTENKLRRNWSCAKCVFDVYKTVGLLYFESIEKINEVSNELENQLEINKLENSVIELEQNEQKTRKRSRKNSKKEQGANKGTK